MRTHEGMMPAERSARTHQRKSNSFDDASPMAEAVRDPAQLPADGGSDNDDGMPAAGARAPAAPRAPAAAPTARPS
jgi:hypothetical protein